MSCCGVSLPLHVAVPARRHGRFAVSAETMRARYTCLTWAASLLQGMILIWGFSRRAGNLLPGRLSHCGVWLPPLVFLQGAPGSRRPELTQCHLAGGEGISAALPFLSLCAQGVCSKTDKCSAVGWTLAYVVLLKCSITMSLCITIRSLR